MGQKSNQSLIQLAIFTIMAATSMAALSYGEMRELQDDVKTYETKAKSYQQTIRGQEEKLKAKEGVIDALHRSSKENTATLQQDLQKARDAAHTYKKERNELKQQLDRTKEEAAKQKSKTVSVRDAKPSGKGSLVASNFEVTWYNDYGITKSGATVKDGVTIAVDPKVIPLGTWVRLEFPDGQTMVRRAEDTGGKVKGNIIDIYASAPRQELLQRGRTHNVKVSIL